MGDCAQPQKSDRAARGAYRAVSARDLPSLGVGTGTSLTWIGCQVLGPGFHSSPEVLTRTRACICSGISSALPMCVGVSGSVDKV